MNAIPVADKTPTHCGREKKSRCEKRILTRVERSGFPYGQNPDSEQIERIEPMVQKRNSVSVEEIQECKTRLSESGVYTVKSSKFKTIEDFRGNPGEIKQGVHYWLDYFAILFPTTTHKEGS